MNEFEHGRGDSCVIALAGSAGAGCTEVQVAILGAVDVDRFKTFGFDCCFGAEASQHELFETSGVCELLDSAIDGYSATVFAYGQTGSGKTYTMSGNETWLSNPAPASAIVDPTDGIIQRSARHVFGAISNVTAQAGLAGGVAARPLAQSPKFGVRMSFCEIYNENVFDLLNPDGTALSVRWNAQAGFFVQSLFLVDCDGLDDAMAVIAEGHRNRTVGGHVLNKDSSRSHSLLTMHIDCESSDPEDGHAVKRFGKVVFVDLAGSERLKDTRSAHAEETGAINKSLFCLGKVISALSSKRQQSSTTFVPYRDSNLTKLLMDSLGGSSLTLMIACCSPSSVAAEETLSTLQYATRARTIQNKPTLQVDARERTITSLRREVEALRTENEHLRNTLAAAPTGMPERTQLHDAGATATTDAAAGTDDEAEAVASRAKQATSRSPPLAANQRSTEKGARPFSESACPKLQRHATPPPGLRPTYSSSSLSDLSSGSGVHKGGYQQQVAQLSKDVAVLQQERSAAEHGYRSVMAENERLCQKLKHLESIFMRGNDATQVAGSGKSRRSIRPAGSGAAAVMSGRDRLDAMRKGPS